MVPKSKWEKLAKMNIKDFTDAEKTILKSALDDSELTLPEILEKTKMKTGEAEETLKQLIDKRTIKKLTRDRNTPSEREVYSFRYAISNDGLRLVDIAEQEALELYHNVCP
jgi:transcription initiation factor IIE alpha subunit